MCMGSQLLSYIWFFVALWTITRQAPLSMKFSRQECWSGLSFPPPGDLPNPGIKLAIQTPASRALAGRFFFTSEPPGKPKTMTFIDKQKLRICCSLTCYAAAAAAAAKSIQSCPTPCDPIDGSPPGFPVPGILQARTLEWVAISFSNAWNWKVKVKSLSRVRLLATSWIEAYQAPPSMGFSRQ